jgi:hypothetical protein
VTLLLLLGGGGEQVEATAGVEFTLFNRSAAMTVQARRTLAMSLFGRSNAFTLSSLRVVDLGLWARTVALTLPDLRIGEREMSSTRPCVQSPVYQGEDESIIYTVTTTNWVSSPASSAVVVKDVSNSYSDVTSTVMPTNTPSESGDVITLSALTALTAGSRYRVEVQWTASSSTWETWFDVLAER